MKQICICRLDKMGDMILSLPAIKGIKVSNPNTKIHLLASENNAKVLEGIEYIDKITIIKKNINLYDFYKNLIIIRKSKFDYFLNFSPTFLSYFFCFFSKSKKKGTLIFLSRYKKSIFSKLLIRLLSNIFCNYIYKVNRYLMIKNKKDIHQTKMIFQFINSCNINYNDNINIDIVLPKKRLNLTSSNKHLVTIHLTSKWINKFYSEKNFLNLIYKLPTNKNSYVLTTDNSTKQKFKEIYEKFSIIKNSNFFSKSILKESFTILDNLSYENWKAVIYSSNQVITPECGCSHVAAACNSPVIIIYDSENLPESIYNEYHPWKSEHRKLIFNDKDLNEKIINYLI